MPIKGKWALHVYDREVDGLAGQVDSFKLHFRMEACSPKLTWTRLVNPPSTFTPRYRHGAIVVGASMFVVGGHATAGTGTQQSYFPIGAGPWEASNLEVGQDYLWRFDRNGGNTGLGSWIDKPLRSVNAPPPEHVGGAMLMTPWRVVAIGGFQDASYVEDGHWHSHGHWYGRGHGHGGNQGDGGGHKHEQRDGDRYRQLGPVLWQLDPVTGLWDEIHTNGVQGLPRPHMHRAEGVRRGNVSPESHAAMPGPRYLSATALAGAHGTPSRQRGVRRPRVLVFGGYDGVRYLDDLWELNLDELGEGDGSLDEKEEHDALCKWRREEGTTARGRWDESCGANTFMQKEAQRADDEKRCDLKDLLIHTWCDRQWQGLGGMWLSGMGGT